MIYSYKFKSELCHLNIFFDEDFLYAISFTDDKDGKIKKYLNKNFGEIQEVYEDNIGYSREIEGYLRGQVKEFHIPVKFFGTDFQEKVWSELLNLAYGQTITYKEMADRIGHPKAYRAVGGALNKNPIAIVIPCHRVVGSGGSLTGFAGGIDLKEKLLNLESKHREET